jgi:lauroyl/myristoyl acyltransferase
MAELSRHVTPLYVLAFPKLMDTRQLPAWLQQHARICSDAGCIGVPSDAGFETFVEVLQRGDVLTAAFDLPGRTPAHFVGRDLTASFGAPRMAFATGSLVVPATSELVGDKDPLPLVRFHEPIDPADFESPQALMEHLLQIHEPYVTRWPELYDIPTSHWGVPAPADTTGAQR